MKSLYVGVTRVIGGLLNRLGIYRLWEREPRSRARVWARSLFAIYNIDDMVHLDLPWWNLRAADRVDAFLGARPGARVFEFGSGASTVWLARRAKQVVTVEHDPDWANVVRQHASERVELRLVTPDEVFDSNYASERRDSSALSFRAYASSIDAETEPFDLIVIDGRARAQCLRHALPHLAKGGVILFDDTRRKRYRRAIAATTLHETRYLGLSACVPYPDATSLLEAGTA